MDSSTVAKGRWKQAIGLSIAILGHPLVAMMIPIIEASPSWTVVSLEQVLAAEIQDTLHGLWEGVSLKA